MEEISVVWYIVLEYGMYFVYVILWSVKCEI